jgi:hypothetical protein
MQSLLCKSLIIIFFKYNKPDIQLSLLLELLCVVISLDGADILTICGDKRRAGRTQLECKVFMLLKTSVYDNFVNWFLLSLIAYQPLFIL